MNITYTEKDVKLYEKVEQLAINSDIETMTKLLVNWEEKSMLWLTFVESRLSAPTTTKEQAEALVQAKEDALQDKEFFKQYQELMADTEFEEDAFAMTEEDYDEDDEIEDKEPLTPEQQKLKNQLDELMEKADDLQYEGTKKSIRKSISTYKKAIKLMDNNPVIKEKYEYLYAHYIMSFLYPRLGEGYDEEIVAYSKKGLEYVESIFIYAPFMEEGQFYIEAIRTCCNAIVWHSLPSTNTQEGLEELLEYVNKGCEYAQIKEFPNIYGTKACLLLKMGRKEDAYKLALKLKKARVDDATHSEITSTEEFKKWINTNKEDLTQEKNNYIKSLKNADGSNDLEYNFDQLKEAMYLYCKAVEESYGEDFKNQFEDFVSVSDKDIDRLEKQVGFTLPKDLRAFYKKIGQLVSFDSESFAYRFNPPEKLLVSFFGKEITHNFGIVDFIIESWGDRPEFENPEDYEDSLTHEETNYLNENFKCIGTWSCGWGYEASYYLIFDKQGNYDYVYYHQDEFSDATEKLKELVKNGITKSKTLEEILTDSLKENAKDMIESYG